jgi:hypothetical protein
MGLPSAALTTTPPTVPRGCCADSIDGGLMHSASALHRTTYLHDIGISVAEPRQEAGMVRAGRCGMHLP